MTNPTQTHPQVCLFGAAPSTGNLGVSALFHSAVYGLFAHDAKARVTVFDFGRGSGPLEVQIGDQTYQATWRGANNGKRFWRHDTLASMRFMGRLGGLGNPGVKAIRQSQAVWDVSGGDSFTDLYGVKRFWTTTHPKLLATEQSVPLVLLPQTYGPFSDKELFSIASDVTRKAAVAWARDNVSFEGLKELLGADFDADRHRVGVDLAFGLPTTPPRDGMVPVAARKWLEEDQGAVGVNVSGLIYLDSKAAKERYGFKSNYSELVHGLIRGLIERGERVILVPHVIEPEGNVESDPAACKAVQAALSPAEREHVSILSPPFTAAEVKAVIAQMKWFCGTRMHSTIGALSSGVPTAAVAYSLKFQGVFETCDQAAGVANPRELDTADCLAHLLESFDQRKARKEQLDGALPRVRAMVAEQMDHLLAASGIQTP